MKSYVIHLAGSTSRDPLVEGLNQALPGGTVLPAVDGRKMPAEARAAVAVGHLLDPAYPFGLMPSEIGCFLSHRAAWAALVESGEEMALVAEDDVATGEGFPAALKLALAHGGPDCLIRFPMRDREVPDRMVAEADGVRLFRPKVIGLTAALYLIGRDAAARLLERSERFDRPVDTWMQMRWETGVDSLTLWPAHIRSAAPEHGGSTIQKKKGIAGEIARTWRRARYRQAVTKLSAKS